MPDDIQIMIADINKSVDSFKERALKTAKKYNKQLWLRIVFIFIALVVNGLIGLGFIDGTSGYDIAALIGIFGLDITGGYITVDDMRNVWRKKSYIADRFKDSLNLLDDHRENFAFIQDNDIKLCAIEHLGVMKISLKPLVELKLNKPEAENELEALYTECKKISELSYRDKDYCDKVDGL